ncbi:MAG: phage tail tape measure protein [Elusimicrobia bacterium]|nr:phage tail tape measure protein [Elusimicrobiota bacterium]
MADSDGKVRIIIDTNAEAAAKQLNDVGTAFKKNADTIQKSSTAYSGYEKAVRDNIEVLRELALGGNQNTEGFKKLAAETKNYKQALDEANSAVSKAVGGFQQQSNPVSTLTTKLKGLVGAYLGLQGIKLVFNGLMQATEAFREQERAVLSLNNTLANAGVYSDAYSKHIQALASEIQSYTNFGDEAIIKAQALGQSFIGQTKITDDLTKATVDFAAATGMELEQAFTLVGKSIGSPTNALARYGVELKKGMTDQEKMIAITTQLGNRYEGQAKQMANASAQLKNAMGDLAEEIGGVFNPLVQSTQRILLSAAQATTKWIHSIREANKQNDINALNEALKYQQEQLKKATGEEKKLWEQRIAQTQKYLNAQKEPVVTNKKARKISDEIPSFSSYSAPAKAIKASTGTTSQATQIKDAYDLATEAVEKARRAVLNAGVQFGASSPEVAKAFEQYKIANEKIAGLQDIFKVEETTGAYEKMQQRVNELTQSLRNLAAENKINTEEWNLNKTALEQAQAQLDETNKKLEDTGIKTENLSQSISSSLSSGIINAVRNGGNAFDAFSNLAVAALQKLLDKVIEMAVVQPILNSFTNSFSKTSAAGGFFTKVLGFFTKSANGNVFSNGKVLPFARGGIVNKPTLFPMKNGTGLMGEAGPEAIMPLTRKNGKLGVEASGNQTVVNIYNQSQSQIETRQREDGGMDVIIKRVNQALMSERTSSGFRAAYQREDKRGVQAC